MIREIYIPLLNEDIDVWKPVKAEHINGERYKILGAEGAVSKSEQWKFLPGTTVFCEYILTNEGNRIFAAVSAEK